MYANLLILCVQEHGLQICKAKFVVSTGTMLANSYKTKVVGGIGYTLKYWLTLKHLCEWLNEACSKQALRKALNKYQSKYDVKSPAAQMPSSLIILVI